MKDKEWLKEEIRKNLISDTFSRLELNMDMDELVCLIDQLDRPTKITLNDVINRLDGLEKNNRLSWINKILHNFKAEYNSSRWKSGYEQGKIDGIAELQEEYSLIKKPVIPQFVANEIERYEDMLDMLYWEYFKKSFEKIDDDNLLLWIDENQYTLARAWLGGYQVEKEKKYYVLNDKGATMLVKTPSGEITCSNCSDLTSVRDEYLEKYQLTEKEIKAVDKRYWGFAKPVEEVTE